MLPPNRQFGFFFAGVFACVAAYCAYKGYGFAAILGWLIAGAVAGLVAQFAPERLAPFNRAWMALGDLLSKIVSPLALGVIFFGIITPTALIGRLSRRDELRLGKADVRSHWIDRSPPGPDGASFKNQF